MKLQGSEGRAMLVKRAAGLSTLVCLVMCSSTGANTQAASPATDSEGRATVDDRLEGASESIREFRSNMPDSVARRPRCIVVVPEMLRAGVLVGGQSGKGFASCKSDGGWSQPAPISIYGGSIGAQVGVESSASLTLVVTEKAERALLLGKFRIGVDASATAGPVGRGRGASTDMQGGDVLSYSRARGLFAGAVFDGATIQEDDDTTRVLYGRPVPFRQILEGQVSAPADPAAQRLVSTIRQSFGGPMVSGQP